MTPRQHAKDQRLPYALVKLDKRTQAEPGGMLVYEGPVGPKETELIEELLVKLAKTAGRKPA